MTDLFTMPLQPSNNIDWLSNLLSSNDLDATLYAASPSDWEEVWAKLRYQPIRTQRTMLDYQKAYLEGGSQLVHDISLTLKSDGHPVGIIPLSAHRASDKWTLSSMGNAINAPLFTDGISPRTIKKITSRLIAAIRNIAAKANQRTILFEQAPHPGTDTDTSYSCSEWHQQLMALGAKISIRHDLYCNLTPDLPSIRSTFRKSYRPLINLALRTWICEPMDSQNLDHRTWTEFKQLHKEVSGRSTRSDATWMSQFEMILNDKAILISIRDPESHKMVGAGFFQYSSSEGLYSVGAYDRSLFDKPLGHAIQQRAIEILKSKGIEWYHIGERHYHQSPHHPSAKEVAISEFKQGFASHIFCRHQFELPTIPNEVDGQ